MTNKCTITPLAARTTVSLPKEISALFAYAHDNFPAIIVKSSEDEMQILRRRNFQALQDIYLGDSTDATGVILSEVDGKRKPGVRPSRRSTQGLRPLNLGQQQQCCLPTPRENMVLQARSSGGHPKRQAHGEEIRPIPRRRNVVG